MATRTVVQAGGSYNLMSSAVAALPATFTEVEVIELQGFDLVDLVDTFGKMTAADKWLEIRAAAGHEYDPVTNTGARIRCGAGAAMPAITFSGRHIRFKNIGIIDDGNTSNYGAIFCSGAVAGSDIRFDGCFLKSVLTGTNYAITGLSTANANVEIKNTTVVSACRTLDLRSAGSSKLHNSVFYRTAAQIGVLAGAATEIKNCYSGSTVSGADAFWTGATPTGGNNASSDATANFGTGNIINLAPATAFTAPGSSDFSTQPSTPLRDSGVTIATVTTDAKGVTRPQGSAYDIGALEGVVTGGTSSIAASGGAVASGSATLASLSGGSFTTLPMENNTGSGLLANIAVSWTWIQGQIGSAPTSLTHGSGTTNASGVITASGLPSGAGVLLVESADGGIYVEKGTVP